MAFVLKTDSTNTGEIAVSKKSITAMFATGMIIAVLTYVALSPMLLKAAGGATPNEQHIYVIPTHSQIALHYVAVGVMDKQNEAGRLVAPYLILTTKTGEEIKLYIGGQFVHVSKTEKLFTGFTVVDVKNTTN